MINTTLIEVQILIAASIASVLGLIAVYFFQKKGYLNNKFVNYSLLLFSIAFLLGASFLGYASYNSYSKRVKTLKSFSTIEEVIFNGETLGTADSNTFINLKDNQSILLGYEAFLIETAQNYDPSEYSYANVLKTEYIEQLSNKAGTQTYWDQILNSVYVFDTINNSYKRGGYEIMYVFSAQEYPNEDLAGTTDMNFILKTSIREYWQAQLLDADRSPESIVSFWRDNKAFMYTFFSKSQYDRLCKKVVDDLIAIKQKVNQQPNYQEFYDTYDISDPKFLTFPTSAFVKSYAYSWPFSFWDRRHEEQNDEAIYKILKEIQLHYQN